MSKNKWLSSSFVALVTAAVGVASVGVAHAEPSSTCSTNYSIEQTTVSVDSGISEQDFQELFAVIESIPDEVLQSEEAFNSWKEA